MTDTSFAVPLLEYPLRGDSPFPDNNGRPIDHLGRVWVQLLQENCQEDPNKTLRRALKVGVVALAALARVPYLSINNELGEIIGPICASAHVMAFFAVTLWAGNHAVDDELGPRTIDEIKMSQRNQSKSCFAVSKKAFILSAATALACLSSLPQAFAAYKYNPEQFKVAAAVILVISNSLFSLRSLQLSFSDIRFQSTQPVARKLNAMRVAMVQLLENSHNVGILNQILGVEQEQEDITTKNQYCEIILGEKPSTEASKGRNLWKQIGEITGVALTLFYLFTLGYFVYKTTISDVKKDDKTLAGLLAAVSVGSVASLTGKSIQKTAGNTFAFIYSFFRGSNQLTVAQQMRPNLTAALQTGGLIIDGFALGAAIKITSDLYDESKVGQVIAAAAIAFAVLLLFYTAMKEVIDTCAQKIIYIRGTEEERALISVQNRCQRLASSINRTPLSNFAVFVLELPEEIQERYMKQYDLSVEDLNQYVSENNPIKDISPELR